MHQPHQPPPDIATPEPPSPNGAPSAATLSEAPHFADGLSAGALREAVPRPRFSSQIAAPGLATLGRLAWPVMVEQLLNMLVQVSDTFLVGQYLSQTHLAAMTSMCYLMWLLSTAFAVIALGVAALVARSVGASDYAGATRSLNQGFAAGSLLAIVLTLVLCRWDSSIVSLMQLQDESGAYFARFLMILAPALPAMMVEQIGLAALRGAGDMVAGLWTMALVNLVNLAVSWTLLAGFGPIAPLGWDALAIGAACGHVAGTVATLALLARGRGGLGLRRRDFGLDIALQRRILRVGIPGGLDLIGQSFLQLFFLSLINRLGETAAAAHGVAIRIESLSYLPAIAFQMAAATLTGQYLGACDAKSAVRSVRMACAAGAAVMLVASVGMYCGSDYLPSLCVSQKNRQVSQLAAPLLRIVSTALVPLVILNVFNGALRGAGDTRWPLAIMLIGFIGIRIPLALWLVFYADFGVAGAWYAMAIDLYIRAALISGRFLQGGWLRVRV